jgi:NADPH:quinone reductase-like Zn-dependent oxidoreductase
MKAAVYRRYGSPDVVTADQAPTPVPRDDEILVRVRAATVGIVDSLARRGQPRYARMYFGAARTPVWYASWAPSPSSTTPRRTSPGPGGPTT